MIAKISVENYREQDPINNFLIPSMTSYLYNPLMQRPSLFLFSVILNEKSPHEVFFVHDRDTRRNFIASNQLSRGVASDIQRHLKDLYRDLPYRAFWGVLLGYDGGRKEMYRQPPNFVALIDKIDAMPEREREAQLQATQGVSCRNSI